MAAPNTLAPLEDLRGLPASDVKKRGWRDVVRVMNERGVVLVTNHDRPEAVIISPAEYAMLRALVQEAESRALSELEALRLRFDARLAALDTPGAGARLRDVMRRPARLRGRVKAGSGR